MFTTPNIKSVLKSVVLDSEDDRRIAKCALHVPVSYELAKEAQ